MRYSWHYLENMLVCRIDSRKMAMMLEDSKQVNGKLNQLKDHLIEFFHLTDVEDDTIWENDRNEFLKLIEKKITNVRFFKWFKLHLKIKRFRNTARMLYSY